MKIKAQHDRIQDLKVCIYCKKILQNGLETKRGTCYICHNKYFVKSQTKLNNW